MSDDQGHAADCQTAKRPGGWLVAFNNKPDDRPSNFEAGRPYGDSKSIDGLLLERAAIHDRFALEDGGVFELTDC
ncbi:hypothetical protein [Synechococcus sp. MIT S9504]|uniref:hypothetical protein n=1 Tax=Synechococcus sp. MIT S9504 TaxID=1801628 RepID=UPI00082F5ED0|nr:hypothetical protein [Synechococcus sp. MIT S9504]